MRLLRRLASTEGLAAVCVLHQPDLARRYADRILGLRRGRTLFLEPAQAVSPVDVAALYEAVAA